MGEEKETVQIRPEVTILSVLRHLNYKPWFAIAEFVDNSLQSFLANEANLKETNGADYRLVVSIDISTGDGARIVISDNAAGIPSKEFPRAFRAAQLPADRSGLSEFGMGMKSAACWFCGEWSVRTSALNESVERLIAFDVGKIVESRLESIETEVLPAPLKASYTVVKLEALHHSPQGRTIGKIKEHLRSIYRMYLRAGLLNLKFNGEDLRFDEPEVLLAPKFNSHGAAANAAPILWRKSIDFEFGPGHRATGFAALRATGSTQYAGFALFRRMRLIEGSLDETYRPDEIFKQTNSYRFQRLFGELHIEGFEVSHTKDGFRWDQFGDVFLEILERNLTEGPVNLLAQADNFRALPSKKSLERKAEAATASVVEFIENEVEPILKAAKIDPAPEGCDLPRQLDSLLRTSDRSVLISDGTWDWKITIRTTVDPAIEDWLQIARVDGDNTVAAGLRSVTIELSLAHPFSREFIGANNENVELFLRFACAFSLSLILRTDITGDPPVITLLQLNKLLRGAIRHTSFDKND